MSTNTDISIDEKIKHKTATPSKFKVVFLNDDKTPMEWVVKILVELYRHSAGTAEQITMTIHNEGSGIAGVYSHEIAEQKQDETISASRNFGFPLKVTIEEDS